MRDDGAGTLNKLCFNSEIFVEFKNERKIQSLTPIKSAAVHWL